MTGLPTRPRAIYQLARSKRLTTAQIHQLLLNLVPWLWKPSEAEAVKDARRALFVQLLLNASNKAVDNEQI